MIRAAFFFWAFLAAGAAAETVRVKSGEHPGFSRIVIALEEPTPWIFGRTDDGYELRIARPDIEFDVSKVFALIPRSRLADLTAGDRPGSLALSVTCTCHAVLFELRPGYVVIDVSEGAGTDPVFEQFLPADTADAEKTPAQPINEDAPKTAEPAQPEATAPPPVQAEQGDHPDPAPKEEAFDWQEAERAARDQDSTLPIPLNIMDPGLKEVQDQLLRELARAAAQGIVDLAKPTTPRAAPPVRVTSEPVIEQRPAVEHGSMAEEGTPAGHMTVQLEGSGDQVPEGEGRPGLTPSGALCLTDQQLALADWGNRSAAGAQISALRSALLGEFDMPNEKSVEDLVHLYLFLGFGAEAIALPKALGVDLSDVDLVHAIATLLDEGAIAAPQPFEAMERCDTAAALWAVLADPELTPGTKVNTAALMRSFAALPPHLRRHLGPGLSEKFLKFGDMATARAIRDAMLRAPGESTPAMDVLEAHLDLAAGDHKNGDSGLKNVAAQGGPKGAEALIGLVDSLLSRDETVDAPTVLSLSALVQEYKGTALASDLNRAYVLSLGSQSDFESAFAQMAALGGSYPELWRMLVRNGGDATFLTHGAGGPDSKVHDDTKIEMAERLLQIGLPELALAWLGKLSQQSRGRRILAAQADLMRRAPKDALAAVIGMEGADVAALRAQAQTQLGLPTEAAASWATAGETDLQARAAWLDQDWAQVTRSAPSMHRVAIDSLVPLSDVGSVPPEDATAQANKPLAGSLAEARVLLSDSIDTRAVIAGLLRELTFPPGAAN